MMFQNVVDEKQWNNLAYDPAPGSQNDYQNALGWRSPAGARHYISACYRLWKRKDFSGSDLRKLRRARLLKFSYAAETVG